jgi:nucleotide-binding universal stress UspA family protein
MGLSKVLAIVDGTPAGAHALTTALNLGRRFSCRIDVLHVEIDPEASIPILGDGMSGTVVAQMIDSLRETSEARRAEAARMFDELCVAKGVPVVEASEPLKDGGFGVSFSHIVGVEADEVSSRGRLADLIVLARPAADSELDLSPSVDAALFNTGHPVLVVSAAPPEKLLETVAIAWDGSREAARAVTVALPFLKQASKVFVVTAGSTSVMSAPSQLANFLVGHGISAKIWAFTPDDKPTGKAILAETEKAGATLMVMGGYGHSRFREMVLGGVTRTVLNEADLPVFMAH